MPTTMWLLHKFQLTRYVFIVSKRRRSCSKPKFRFYSLYGLVMRSDALKWAWIRVKRNHGAPGVDGVNFDDIEGAEGGVEHFLKALQEELIGNRYKAQAVHKELGDLGFVYHRQPRAKITDYRLPCHFPK